MAETNAVQAPQEAYDPTARYNKYFEKTLQYLTDNGGVKQYSDNQLKNMLTNYIKPSYDQAIRERKDATKVNNAAIDTDAASRGMGSSTWVTDAKSRQAKAEASDIANMKGQYSSTLYNALLDQLNQQNANRMNLMGTAQGLTSSMYDEWKRDEDAHTPSTGGGGAGGDVGSGSRSGRRSSGSGTGDDDDLTGYTMNSDGSVLNFMKDKASEIKNTAGDLGRNLYTEKLKDTAQKAGKNITQTLKKKLDDTKNLR